MPAIGERKTKNGVTGEWDGQTWRRVEAATSGPAIGTRKTKNGITGEWDGTTWRKVADAAPDADVPEKSDGTGALATGGALATLAAGVPAARAVAERVATSPLVGGAVSKLAAGAGALNVGKLGYDLANGRGLSAFMEAAKNEALRQGGKLAYRAAAPAAEALGTGAAAFGAGGLAGLAGTTGFLGALQHDANRTVPMDYTKQNLTEDIARVLGGTGATDAQMDDPNHPAFRPDDSATVTAGEPGGLTAALLRLIRGSR